MPDRQDLIAQLESTMRETLALFDTPESKLAQSYAPGKWSGRELLVHISDAETVLLDRLRRIAAENKPALIAFDQDLWVKELFYATRDLKLAKLQFEAARRNVIELAQKLPASADARIGIHNEAGPLTFGSVIEKVLKHNAHHLEQAQAAIAGKKWEKSA